jgi:hypothetical protein
MHLLHPNGSCKATYSRTLDCPTCGENGIVVRDLEPHAEPERQRMVHYHLHCPDCGAPIVLPTESLRWSVQLHPTIPCDEMAGEPLKGTKAWYDWSCEWYDSYIPGQGRRRIYTHDRISWSVLLHVEGGIMMLAPALPHDLEALADINPHFRAIYRPKIEEEIYSY